MVKGALNVALVTTAFATSASCSYNDIGFVENEVLHTRNAVVRVSTAPGLHFSRTPEGLSITLGLSKTVLAYPALCNTNSHTPELTFQQSYGVGIILSGREASVNLGYRERLKPRAIGINEATSKRIHFEPNRLSVTVIDIFGSDCF